MSETATPEAATIEEPKATDMASEIDAAVDAVLADSADAPAEEIAETPEDPKVEASSDEEETPEPHTKAVELSNTVIERAVKAGLSLDEVKQYPNEALLTAMCDRIEGFAGDDGSPGDAADDHEGVVNNEIPDLDPDEFDDRIVAWSKSMKGIVQQQQEIINELRGERSKDSFTRQAEGVKNFTKGNPEKLGELRAKYDVLKAGYKAADQNVTDESVFSEAAKLVLGSEMESARAKKKVTAARDRNGQFVQRVSGSRTKAPQADVLTETAELLAKKFNLPV